MEGGMGMTTMVYLLASAIIGGVVGGFVVLYILKLTIDKMDREIEEDRR